MNSTVSWECLSVAEFLGGNNWQGLPEPSESVTNLQQSALKNWQILSTKEFFSFGNWQGLSSASTSDRQSRVFSITLPVAEFFQCFGWYGSKAYSNSKIKPAIRTTEDSTTAGTKQITVNNLSQLF